MPNPPRDLSQDAQFGLLFSLLSALEKKGVLSKQEFAAALDSTIAGAKATNAIPPSAASELLRVLKWFENPRG